MCVFLVGSYFFPSRVTPFSGRELYDSKLFKDTSTLLENCSIRKSLYRNGCYSFLFWPLLEHQCSYQPTTRLDH